jgi:hypothetical protein
MNTDRFIPQRQFIEVIYCFNVFADLDTLPAENTFLVVAGNGGVGAIYGNAASDLHGPRPDRIVLARHPAGRARSPAGGWGSGAGGQSESRPGQSGPTRQAQERAARNFSLFCHFFLLLKIFYMALK